MWIKITLMGYFGTSNADEFLIWVKICKNRTICSNGHTLI